MVPVRDKLNDGPMVPEFIDKKSNCEVTLLLPLVAVRFMMTGVKKLNCGSVGTVVVFIEMITL